MVGIIVTGHGNFASGITSALELIVGPQDAYEAIDFTSLSGTAELEKDMTAALDGLRKREDVDALAKLAKDSMQASVVEFELAAPEPEEDDDFSDGI
jgi:PTS system N-acetylgalactosamine-specific IIA component